MGLEIKDAEQIAKKHGLERIIIIGHSDSETKDCFMITWGKTKKICREVGMAGDFIKLYLNEHCGYSWSEDQMRDLPEEYKKRFLKEMEAKVQESL